MTDDLDSLADDPQVLQAAREYLALLESGQKPKREEFLARCPHLTAQLNECFDGIELAHAMSPSSRGNNRDALMSTGTPLGDFQIVREIARGGMGIVYEAIQLSLGRRVALKVLPFAAALDERHLQRFKIEAYAAAQLHHTNIVPVYAVGTDRGVHYYAMQLIEGRSLAELLQTWRSSPAPDTPRGASRTRRPDSATVAETKTEVRSETSTARKSRYRWVAQLMADVADALEFAHSAGVIHRDMKPANILVNDKGRVWVTDFGLAHVATDTSLTRSGEMVGTLRYMSPEQALGSRGQVDHRTDIYSLGATLYEMLTLKPIFPADDRAALLYQILHDDPQPLRQVDASIPIELDTIVAKAIAKSPAERYGTAAELADDLRRFLSERPILARRATVVDRARKWLRRHPAYVNAAGLLLVFGTIGLAIATALVWREQRLTKQALERERERAIQAESRFEMARQVTDELIQLAEDEALDEPFQEGLRTRLLETALFYYQEFIAERADRPLDQAALQTTRDRVQKILDDLAVLRLDRQYFLLREPAVLDDLRVAPEQRAQLRDVLGTFPRPVEGFPDGRRGGGPPMANRDDFGGPRRGKPKMLPRDELIAIARRHEEQLTMILAADQLVRLNQIALQCLGPAVFRDYETLKRLDLSKQQQERIQQLHFQFDVGGPEHGPGPWRQMSTGEAQGLMAMIVQEVFTERQRAIWREMIGPPFSGEISLRMR